MMSSICKTAARRRERKGERGSALLIVFVFAAVLAITLYTELPIVAFESQREKEQLLVDRGNEYARGVKLYVRKTGQYPPSLEAMENTNRMRFLRKRYKDPLTGKDDWRLLHAGPGGIIIDSKVKPVAANGANGSNNLGAPNGNTPGNTGFGSPAGANSPFGSSNANASGDSAFAGFNSPSSLNNTNANSNRGPTNSGNQNTGGFAGSNSGSSNNNRGFGGYLSSLNSNPDAENPRPPSGAVMRQRAAAMAANGGAGATAADGATLPAEGAAAPAEGAAAPANPSLPNNTDPNANVQNGPGMQVSVGQNPAPANNRSGPSNPNSPFYNRTAPGANTPGGLGSPSTSPSGSGVIRGGGIAGIASNAAGTSIKTVNDQDRYKLWEFVYDASKDAARQMAGAMGQTGAAAGSPNGTGSPGNAGFGQGSGSNSSFGNSGFGRANSGFNNQQNSGFGNSNSTSFGNSNSGFGNSNSGFGNSNSNGFGNSNSGFGNSTSGFGNSSPNSGSSSNNGWSNNGNGSGNSQGMSAPSTVRPQQQ